MRAPANYRVVHQVILIMIRNSKIGNYFDWEFQEIPLLGLTCQLHLVQCWYSPVKYSQEGSWILALVFTLQNNSSSFISMQHVSIIMLKDQKYGYHRKQSNWACVIITLTLNKRDNMSFKDILQVPFQNWSIKSQNFRLTSCVEFYMVNVLFFLQSYNEYKLFYMKNSMS